MPNDERLVRRLLIAVLLLLACADAGARSLAIDRFDASIAVAQDGSIDVQESILVRFVGAWNGIYRTIPVNYRTPQGLDYSLRLSVDSVTGQLGQALTYDTSHERRYLKLKIWIPGAEDSTQTVHIHYRVANALRFFDEHDELYWNVTGDEWDVPIAAASARILLPGAVSGVRATAFRGAYGATERNEVAVSDRTIRIATSGLGLHEGLTAVAGWNPGIVHRPTVLERIADRLYSNWALAVPFVVFGFAWVVWFLRGRDPKPAPITTLYEPPAGMSPAEAGVVTDGSVDMRDITATLVDLAVRGYVRIEQQGDPRAPAGAGPGQSSDPPQFAFTSIKPRKEWDSLKTHESSLLCGLFTNGDHVSAAGLRNDFYQYLPEIRDGLYSSLVAQNLYAKDPRSEGGNFVLFGLLLCVGPIVWGFVSLIFLGGFGVPSVTTAGASILSGVILIGFGMVMPARTEAGTRALEGVLGFQEFLSRVDGDRLKRIVQSPELFEKYLPYAMALGVETEWANAFQQIYTHSPDWYNGGPGDSFNTAMFSAQMERMSADLGAVMQTQPRAVRSDSGDSDRSWSSGGSGFSGGSSGGGFGGGGGGGF